MRGFWIRVFLTSLMLAACTRHARDPSQLVIALGSDPPVLDPQLADTGVAVFVLRQVVSTLFEWKPDHSLRDADAASHEWQQGGRRLHVKLRPGLSWSDGVALTACQYRDGILRALDPLTPSAMAELLFEIRGARDFKAAKIKGTEVGVACDDVKASLDFDALTPYSPKLMAALAFQVSAPVRMERVRKYESAWLLGHEGDAPLATGAFVIGEWAHDRRIRLRARTDLAPDRRAQFHEVDLPLVRDPSSVLKMYQAGEVDLVDEIPSALLPKLGERKDHHVFPYFTTYMVAFSFGPDANPVLKNPRVRQALSMTAAQHEVPALLRGGEEAAFGWVPPALLRGALAPADPFDPAMAKRLMAEAGYPDGHGFPMLHLAYNSGERHQMLMERLRNNFKTHLGIETQLEPMEWKVMTAQLKAAAPDLYRYAWTAVYPDALFFLELFLSDSANNFGHWRNTRYDALVKKLGATPVEKRDAAYTRDLAEAQKILVREDPALIPIYHYVRNVLVREDLEGVDFGAGLDLSTIRRKRKD